MPFAVTCSCGKTFNVRDEAQGQTVRCQVCGTEFIAQSQAAEPEEVRPIAVSVTPPIPTMQCPFCAEPVTAGTTICPYCHERLTGELSPEQARHQLDEVVKGIDALLLDSTALAADRKLRGGKFYPRTFILLILSFLCLASFAGGLTIHGDGGIVMAVFGFILAFVFGIAFLVSLGNDIAAAGIQSSAKPKKALERYFLALKTRRVRKAFVALAPSARNGALAKSFELKNVRDEGEPKEIHGLDDFAAFRKTVFGGPSGQSRMVTLKKIKIDHAEGEDMVWLTAEVHVSAYPTWLLFLILLNLIICLVAVLIATKRDKVMVRKLLIRRGERWFVAEAGMPGALDMMRL